jgi:hypothetical protein
MKNSFILLMLMSLTAPAFAQETIEVTTAEKEQVAIELEKEAANPKHDTKTKDMLQKVAKEFKGSKSTDELDVNKEADCSQCEKEQKKKPNFFTKIGRKLGKASAWVTTTTAKPFMNAAGFLTGVFEKKDKNKDVVAMYQFFLNHQEEFDPLYQEAGTAEEMIELMIAQSEEIMEKKSKIILKDILAQLGIKKEIPEDLADFELSEEELASLDLSKLDVDKINNHPEYAEVRPLLGDMTKQDLEDIVMSGYFDKTISFENMKNAVPKTHEIITTVVAQIFAPKIVLGVVSNTLAGLYVAPVVAAQIGTGISTAICLQGETKEKFTEDADLKSFCSYVTNRTGYQLMKSRAKGYVAGKGLRAKLEKKAAERKARRAEKKKNKPAKEKKFKNKFA